MKDAWEALNRVPDLIRQLYVIVDELERLFAPRPFSLDGVLVGSIGEVIAAYAYDLDPFCFSSECHDAKAKDGRMVQVKLTCGTKGVALRSVPEHLIVLQLHGRKQFIEVYNGPGAPAWGKAGTMQKNGQRPISLSSLRELNRAVPGDQRLPKCKEFPVLSLPEVDLALQLSFGSHDGI